MSLSEKNIDNWYRGKLVGVEQYVCLNKYCQRVQRQVGGCSTVSLSERN